MTDHGRKLSVQAVLFDLDGTLLNSFEQHWRSLVAAMADFDFKPPSVVRIRQLMGLPGLETVLTLGVPPEQAHDVWLRWVEWEGRLADMARPFPGVVSLLERLRAAGYRLGIVTSRHRISLDNTPAALDLLPYVELLVTRDDTTEGKPHPDPLLHASQRLGVLPAQGVYVGDASFDVEAGRRAGCLTVLTTWACSEPCRFGRLSAPPEPCPERSRRGSRRGSRRDGAAHDLSAAPEPDFVVSSPDELAALLLD